ncbi:hypothetical protein D9615_001739 [Tricholomella constricta]|uniref:Inhibitor of growth protein N-terminal histone-binding domain-containing protein n=1 Tax=Tricholomella constricta TaxID=117010 RepID=A0A8H5HP17_9AGAR|nr:hypothetical protein D9615_001739 [Tricholomella constricta]
MPSRKRRRTEISLDPEEHLQYPSSPNALLANDPEKEQDVWEAFRDEHFEAIEQVPLTLHRQFALMNELDQQANGELDIQPPENICNMVSGYTSTLLPTLLKYIKKRRDLVRTCVPSNSESDENHSTLIHEVEPKEEQPRSPKPIPASSMPNEPTFARLQSTMPSAAPQGIQGDRSAVPQLSTPLALPRNFVKPPTTTRQMLSHIAGLAEELLRASEEKVNVAQAAYDSVDRHVRILQQAIKEQEASITLGARPGHLEPGNLSDLTVGRWMRPSRATLSPINSDDFEEDRAGDQENAGSVAPPDQIGRIHVPAARAGTTSDYHTTCTAWNTSFKHF